SSGMPRPAATEASPEATPINAAAATAPAAAGSATSPTDAAPARKASASPAHSAAPAPRQPAAGQPDASPEALPDAAPGSAREQARPASSLGRTTVFQVPLQDFATGEGTASGPVPLPHGGQLTRRMGRIQPAVPAASPFPYAPDVHVD